MPPDMAISMRHTKLKAEEAALIAGEISKPSWESRNEGIHERVSFEDTIWGFDLAGGAYYKTPLRVTYVKPDSRADKAGIRPGDKLLRINEQDTSTLTIQEAHKIIVESGIHLRLNVTAPEDEEDSYYCYEDPIVEDEDEEQQRLLEEEKARKREVHAKVSSYWSLQWPWVSKRRVIYRESNCFMVPSKYEDKHRDKFPAQPFLRTQEDIVLHSAKKNPNKPILGRVPSLHTQRSVERPVEEKGLDISEDEDNNTKEVQNNGHLDYKNKNISNGVDDKRELRPLLEVSEDEMDETSESVDNSVEENSVKEIVNSMNGHDTDETEDKTNDDDTNISEVESNDNEQVKLVNGHDDSLNYEVTSPQTEITTKMLNGDKHFEDGDDSESEQQNDEVLNEVLEDENENLSKAEEENILNGILSDSEDSIEKPGSINER